MKRHLVILRDPSSNPRNDHTPPNPRRLPRQHSLHPRHRKTSHRQIFDQVYDAADFGKLGGDANYYKIGRISRHNVVLVKLSGKGTQYSSRSVSDLSQSYPNINVYLLVGICAGVPFRGRERKLETETILGDVIIGDSIIQTDYGKQYSEGYQRQTNRREVLGNPPLDIRNMFSHLWSEPEPLRDRFTHNLDTKNDPTCHSALGDSCTTIGCSDYPHHLINRVRLAPDNKNTNFTPKPLIHFGTIASANTVMKSGEYRDQIVERERDQWDENIIAFEMEGAGMWDSRPCVIIKGVSDYADTHKNDIWHAYAAATAAACTKAFLEL
ncbi:conserved hypothetical protein [Talaromyces stipitatus ATCC 10500]|uniref:Nucleoside phosphorylase domain-containing protein n=1 Tax=Talaromyces stipitatus (strain ATCC 10500 / CBS 375.48 / QM 6759 / NRRL 1006) TaxID=441959 RepID=B8MF75_TALSN|nr:uncharacterized protein TSTA_012810 [Talaromyces stipitatus ATCC 10500]EED16174.1 conserved hypothetical protein [Talaromyces stipitatus ATCC 10500]